MSKKDFKNYNSYLKKTSYLGKFYRRYILYPKLLNYIKGDFFDIGCGLGDFLSLGSNKSIGIDINPFNIEYCIKRGLNAKIIANQVFPLEDNSFNNAVLDQVLEHIKDPKYLLKETRRVLIKKGTLIVGVPCIAGYRRDPDHKLFYDLYKSTIVLKKYGFKVNNFFYYPFPFKIFGQFLSQQSLYLICNSDY